MKGMAQGGLAWHWASSFWERWCAGPKIVAEEQSPSTPRELPRAEDLESNPEMGGLGQDSMGKERPVVLPVKPKL